MLKGRSGRLISYGCLVLVLARLRTVLRVASSLVSSVDGSCVSLLCLLWLIYDRRRCPCVVTSALRNRQWLLLWAL